jgi:hypothetical protein
MLTIEAITAALPHRPGAPTVALDGAVAVLVYPSDEAYCRRVSADVEALRSLAGHVVAESWSPASALPAVHLRYAPAPAAPRVEAPQPIAPRSFAPVPASPSRRR